VTGRRLASWEGHNADYWRRTWHAGAAHFFETVESTNDVAADLAAAGAPDFTVVIAEEQSRGRGRSGARWLAEPGTSLLLSVVFRIEAHGPAPGCAPIRAGLAVAEAITRHGGVNADVKWPNDVVFQNCGKVAGVLCEAALGQQGAGFVIVGIGINVLQAPDQFPDDLRDQACSLLCATRARVERAALLTDVLAGLRSFSGTIAQPLSDSELARFAERDVLRDRAIVCESGAGQVVVGTARGVARDGALLVEQPEGITQVYNATVRLAAAHTYPGSSRG
jgi:BirA family biotin operon repressor/biotin-[acetyl-CoA-carboxylase] ligase